MVHVMSEVKRYWVPCGVLADQSGWHQDDNEVVLAGEHDAALDAQRLCADTAEAELEVLRQQHAEQSCIFCNNSGELLSAVKTERSRGDAAVGDANEAERRLAAAEQRIAELEILLRIGIPTLEYMRCNSLVGMINAALNPNPEAESHE